MSEYSVVVNFAIGFWIFSNKQIFDNLVIPLKEQDEDMNHGHTIIGSVLQVTPGTTFLIFLVFHLFMKSKFVSSIVKNLKNNEKFKNVMYANKELFSECKVPFF